MSATIYKNAVALETQLSGEGADNKAEIIRASQAKLLRPGARMLRLGKNCEESRRHEYFGTWREVENLGDIGHAVQ